MIKEQLKKIIGMENIYYIRSLFPSEIEKALINRRKEFFSGFVNSGDLCFDVGANLGNRIEPLLGIGAKIIALEPQDMCNSFLKKKFGSKITLIKKGVGATNENKTLHISDSHTISSFSEEWINEMKKNRFKNEDWNNEQVMEMVTLDSLIESYGLPQFIKVDVEGYEYEVLKGLTKSVNMISFEYSIPEQTQNIQNCIHHLQNINPNYIFNFSPGETLQFELNNWLKGMELNKYLSNPNNIVHKDSGDIYAKLPN